MAWLFLIVVCGVASLVKFDLYLHKVAFTKFRVRSRKQIRRKIFNVCVKDFYNWRKRLWENSRKNPAIVLLIIAWGFIIIALYLFAPHLYKLYGILSKQIEINQNSDLDYRGIAVRYFGIVAGAGAIIGYIFATGRNIILDNQNKINAQAQITESMVQAITQIGAINDKKPNIEVRLGGLYSLQRIMQNSEENELPVVKILYAYVRENLKRDKTKQPKKINRGFETYKMPEDIQAALNIISQFNKEQREQGKKLPHSNQLSFAHADFSDYSLEKMDFSHANFENANLSGTDLCQANLSNAFLRGANLSGVYGASLNLYGVSYFGANFSGANLSCVFMGGSDFVGIDFSDAILVGVSLCNEKFFSVNFFNTDLENVRFDGADLSEAFNLTQEQLSHAYGDEKTILPKGLAPPESWKEPTPKQITTTMRTSLRKLP